MDTKSQCCMCRKTFGIQDFKSALYCAKPIVTTCRKLLQIRLQEFVSSEWDEDDPNDSLPMRICCDCHSRSNHMFQLQSAVDDLQKQLNELVITFSEEILIIFISRGRTVSTVSPAVNEAIIKIEEELPNCSFDSEIHDHESADWERNDLKETKRDSGITTQPRDVSIRIERFSESKMASLLNTTVSSMNIYVRSRKTTELTFREFMELYDPENDEEISRDKDDDYVPSDLDNFDSSNMSDTKTTDCETESSLDVDIVSTSKQKTRQKKFRSHKCQRCEKEFESTKLLKEHTKIHLPMDKNLECSMCLIQYARRGHLQRHIESVHKAEKCVCEECGKTFKSMVHLKRHMYAHSEKQFKCEECGKCFQRPKTLREHKKLHDPNTPRLACSHCDKSFLLKDNLTVHIRTHTGDRPYTCHVCGKRYYTSGQVSKHIRKVHAANSYDDAFQCKVCGTRLKDKVGYDIHMKRHEEIEKSFSCTVCEMKFYYKRQLDWHVTSHDTDLPFPCPVCDARFRSKTHLAAHELIHTGEKKLACPQCGKMFLTSGRLSHHVKTHSDEKRFKCEKCSKAFRKKDHLAKHLRMQGDCIQLAKKYLHGYNAENWKIREQKMM